MEDYKINLAIQSALELQEKNNDLTAEIGSTLT